MSKLISTKTWLDRELPDLLSKHGVPGAAWAVLHDGEVVDGAAGLLNLSTRVKRTILSLP